MGTGQLYFWTFTRRKCEDVKHVRKSWNKALTYIKRACPTFCGVRVFELHPGGHGLHVHVVTNARFDVRVVRSALRKTGWGRMHVMRLHGSKVKTTAGYCSKYCTKAKRPECLKGWRLWAPFGKWEHCRCLDVAYDSTPKRVYEWLGRNVMDWESMKWYERYSMMIRFELKYWFNPDLEFDRLESGELVLNFRGSPLPDSILTASPRSCSPCEESEIPAQLTQTLLDLWNC